MTRFRRPRTKKLGRDNSRRRAIAQRFPMRCILERHPRTEGQVHAGTAHSRRIVAVNGGDSRLGKIFWPEAADSAASNEPARADRYLGLTQCGAAGNN